MVLQFAREIRPLAVTVLVLLAFSWYYFINLGFPVNAVFINAVVAFTATVLISLSFFLGPLTVVLPFLKRFIHDRKALGLWGYGFAILHTILVVFVLLGESREVGLADVTSLGFAAVAFLVFTLMALTSTNEWLKKLGYDNWKNLQRTGYIALLFVFAHIILLEQGIFLTRLTGQIVLTIILIILFLRGLLLVLRVSTPDIKV